MAFRRTLNVVPVAVDVIQLMVGVPVHVVSLLGVHGRSLGSHLGGVHKLLDIIDHDTELEGVGSQLGDQVLGHDRAGHDINWAL